MPMQYGPEAASFTGPVYFNDPTCSLPANAIGDTQVNASAPIQATKLQHQFQPVYSQKGGSAVVAERETVHVAKGAGTLIEFRAGAIVAAIGDSTMTVDLQKNGTTMLSAPISLTSANAAYAKVTGTLSVTAYVAGDVLEVVTTISAGTGTLAKGVFATPTVREAA